MSLVMRDNDVEVSKRCPHLPIQDSFDVSAVIRHFVVPSLLPFSRIWLISCLQLQIHPVQPGHLIWIQCDPNKPAFGFAVPNVRLLAKLVAEDGVPYS